MIKVVSFDIGGTLLENSDVGQDKYSLEALVDFLGLPHDEVKKAYKKVFQKMNGGAEELIDRFTSILNIKPTKGLYDFITNKFNIPDTDVSSDKLELLKKIKKLGYKIILFSNNCCLVKSTIREKTKTIVDKVYYSYELGYTKNESESYRIIEKELGYKPDEFLHIGDTLKSDYLCPIENGWNALFYGNTDDTDIKCIADLNDILKYLEDNN